MQRETSSRRGKHQGWRRQSYPTHACRKAIVDATVAAVLTALSFLRSSRLGVLRSCESFLIGPEYLDSLSAVNSFLTTDCLVEIGAPRSIVDPPAGFPEASARTGRRGH